MKNESEYLLQRENKNELQVLKFWQIPEISQNPEGKKPYILWLMNYLFHNYNIICSTFWLHIADHMTRILLYYFL